MDNRPRAAVERLFESLLFNSRLIVLIAVLGALVAAVCMFLRGGWAILKGIASFFFHHSPNAPAEEVPVMVVQFIGAVDNFLFAMVLLIFSMGIYELFVSRIDPASRTPESRPNWLRITSLEDLKSYLGKVVLMILIVNLFEQSFHLRYETPVDLLSLGGSIVLVALSLFLTHGRVHAREKES